MNKDRNITISNTYGLTTRTTTGQPVKRATKRKPISFGPELDTRGPQGPGAEARFLMEHHRNEAQQTIENAIRNGASRNDALRMARNALKAGRRAQLQYQAALHGAQYI